MKVILIGYPLSQRIVPASKYLTSKYLPGFDITYLNYTGGINWWSDYLLNYLKDITDEHIILALDDYLVSDYIDMDKYHSALAELKQNRGEVICVKLCNSTLKEHEEYPCTTQYTIWDKAMLVWLLKYPEILNPWQFEILGSKQFSACRFISLHRPCLKYFTNSSISSRWEGVRLDGLSEDDKKYIIDNGLIS